MQGQKKVSILKLSASRFFVLTLSASRFLVKKQKDEINQKRKTKLSASRFFLIFAYFSIFTINAANAEVVHNLYKSSILVPNSSESTRKEAASKSMAQILVRASGKIGILSNPSTKDYLENGINYISEFRYERTQRKLRLENGSEVWAQNLYLTFDKSAINKIITQLGYGIWDTNRPKTLFWILIKDKGKSYLLNSTTNSNLANSITSNSWARGLPTYLPKLDWQDAKHISATNIWNMDLNSAINASKSYKADAVVIGRIYRQENTWKSDWALSSGGKRSDFSYQNENQSALLRLATYQVVENLANQYAIQAGSTSYSSQIEIIVDGIENFEDYSIFLRYLEKNPTVSYANLVTLNSKSIKILLNLKASEQQFLSNIRLDKKLLPLAERGKFRWR